MSTRVPLLLVLFGLTLPLPFVLAVREMLWPKDKLVLSLDDSYVRDPRQFAVALREHLLPHLDERKKDLEVQLQRRERVMFHEELSVPANTKVSDILVIRGSLVAAPGATLQEAWVQGDATLEQGATVRGLACDGDLRLGPKSVVGRWIDSEQDAYVERGCDLGTSATAVGTLSISPECSFRRLWGQPIRTLGTPRGTTPGDGSRIIEDEVLWAGDRLSIPPGAHLTSGVVVHGRLDIGAGAIIDGSVKAEGECVIGDSVRISGNVIGRKSIRIGNGAQIDGNVFAEHDVTVGSSTVIGSEGGTKTVYAAGHVMFGSCTSIYGWVVAERGGSVKDI